MVLELAAIKFDEVRKFGNTASRLFTMNSEIACSAFDRLSSYQWSRLDRERSLKSAFLKFRGLIAHFSFLVILTLIVILRSDENQYHVKTALLTIFAEEQFDYITRNVTTWRNFDSLRSRKIFYEYLESIVLPSFYRGGRKDVPLFATIRQARVKNDLPCYPIVPDVPTICYPDFKPSTESRAPFGPKDPRYWRYSSSHDDVYISGTFAYYPPDGYIFVLPPLWGDALLALEDMEENSWVDGATRAVTINVYVFNHNVNLLCDVQLLIEMTKDGVMYPSETVTCAPLIEYHDMPDYWRLACDIMVYLIVIYIIFREIFLLITLHIARLLSLTTIVRIIMFFCFGSAIICFIKEYNCTTRMLYMWEYVRDDDIDEVLRTVSDIHCVSVMDERGRVYFAVGIFCAWLILFRYVIFVQSTEVIRIIKNSKQDLLHFITFYLIVMFGFALCAFLVFGGNISQFKSFGESVMTLFSILQGDFDPFVLRTEYNLTGFLFFVLVAFILYFVCNNMFFVIVNYHYDAVISNPDDNVTDKRYELLLTNAKRNILGKMGCWKKPSALVVNREALKKLGFSTSTIQAYESLTLGKTHTGLMRNLGDGVLLSEVEKVAKKIYEMEKKIDQVFDDINVVFEFTYSKY